MEKENEISPEASFEKFILDFSKENRLVNEILKSNEIVSKINQDSLAKTKRKVEGLLNLIRSNF